MLAWLVCSQVFSFPFRIIQMELFSVWIRSAHILLALKLPDLKNLQLIDFCDWTPLDILINTVFSVKLNLLIHTGNSNIKQPFVVNDVVA